MGYVKTRLVVFTVSMFLVSAVQSGCESIFTSPEPSNALPVTTEYSEAEDGTATVTTTRNPLGLEHATHWLCLIDVNL